MVNAYEQERLDNIAANQALMAQLQIQSAPKPVAPPPVKTKAKPKKSAAKKASSSTPARPMRTSARNAGRTTNYNEDKLSRTTRPNRSLSPVRAEDRYLRGSSYLSEPERERPRPLNQLDAPLPPPDLEPGTPHTYDAPPPTFEDGFWKFEEGFEGFRPSMHPKEIMENGSFGGTYWRFFRSSVLHKTCSDHDYDEFPKPWWEFLDAKTLLNSQEYDVEINKYGVKASQSIEDWEKAGWIRAQDPRGWMQWYFRFFNGRRSEDDARQIGRWAGCAGPRGRFKTQLVKKIHQSSVSNGWDDPSISPILRQTLQHWAVRLSEAEYKAYTT